ncbi:MAG: hypothetical protein C4B55_01420 [Candidatus Methanophagaceae archaeon]|nr:MAG: hypothetical protein C4B55_01420 [Methanophagales archaeon]
MVQLEVQLVVQLVVQLEWQVQRQAVLRLPKATEEAHFQEAVSAELEWVAIPFRLSSRFQMADPAAVRMPMPKTTLLHLPLLLAFLFLLLLFSSSPFFLVLLLFFILLILFISFLITYSPLITYSLHL